MILVSDNLQGTRPPTRALLERGDAGPVRELVRRMVLQGARMIDVNPGPLRRDAARRMTSLVEAVRSVTDLPLLVDSADPAVMEAGLVACGRAAILNGFSPEPRKIERLLPLAVRYGADAVGYLVDGRGLPPPSAEERLGIAVELLAAAEQAGLPRERLIVDPFLAPLIWEDGQRRNAEALEVIRRLPEVLGFSVRTVVGFSNLTSGSPAPRETRRRAEAAFLPMLAAAGLHMVMLDVFNVEAVRTARACQALLSPRVFAWESL